MKIIVVSALWCPSCLILNKNLKKLKEKHPEIEIVKYDYDFDEEEVKKFEVGKILPVIIKGEERLVGEKTYEEIEKFISK